MSLNCLAIPRYLKYKHAMAKTNKHHSPIARMIKTRSLSIYQAIAFEELAALLEIHERGTYVRTSTVRKVKEPIGPRAIDAGKGESAPSLRLPRFR